jgi:hypothetical protein
MIMMTTLSLLISIDLELVYERLMSDISISPDPLVVVS